MHLSKYLKIVVVLLILALFSNKAKSQVFGGVSFNLYNPDVNTSISIIHVNKYVGIYTKKDTIFPKTKTSLIKKFEGGLPVSLKPKDTLYLQFSGGPFTHWANDTTFNLGRPIIQVLYLKDGNLYEMTLIIQYKNYHFMTGLNLYIAGVPIKPGVYNVIIDFSKKEKNKQFRTTPQLIRQE